MYLKNIEVYGFKSFAQKINFEFHNGITGIVGPNGSGKSNVGDAVRWVLGEQSAKQLRGGNMQDVIFSGTENRKPLSFASVSITLDNSDHKLPVDYNEVTVTRRLYRSGESEYLINGSGCRLKDIQEMFYDTGIGKEGYSIIGQGQIDKILSGKPEERRELFDEAAGIVKFKRRKATTLKKLDEERQNLVRVTDILSELTKQLGPLEKQSETARIYLAKREELKELDVNLFLLDHQRTGELLKELEEKLEQAQRELNEAQAAYDQTKIEYDRLEQELEDLNHRLDTLKEEQQQNALLKQQYEGQVQVLEEQISSGKQNSEHYQNRLTALGEDLDRRTQEKEKLAEDKLELQSRLKEIRASLSKETEALENIVSNVEECTQAVEDGKNEIIEILNSRATTKGKVQRFDAMLEQLNIRKAEISQRILRLKSEEEVLEKERLNAQKQYDAVTAVIHSTNEECVRLDGEVQKLQDELKKQNSQMEIGQTAYHREASRLESLKNITERYDGYGNSIRRVMEQKNREPGIKGVVADIIHVQKDYEVAIETALGGSIQNIVTDNEQTAKRMIGFLKKNRFGRATFLPLSNISGRGGLNQRDVLSEPGVVGTANTLVNADKEYSELVMYLLGRVLVVDNIDHAIAIGKKYRHSLRMVTIEGESLSPGGSMTGGAFKNNSNLLGRRREIEELERSVGILRKELEETQKHAADFQPGIDLPLDVPHRPHQLRHVLRRQIVRLDGDKHIIRRGQGVDDQHTQRGTAIQQNIVIIPLYAVHILTQHRFPAHYVHQSYLYGGQAAVSRHKVKALMVAHDLRVVAGHCPGHNVVHGVGKGQGQVVGLALAQHLGQITLGVYVQQQDFLSFQRKTGPQVIDRCAFANSALLICYTQHFRFRHLGFPPFIDLAACGETDGYVWAWKKPPFQQ